jgi:hypothetical protein
MGALDSWIYTLPVNESGRPLLTLERARDIARLHPTGWYIAPFNCGYAAGKTTAYPERECFHIVDENNEPIRFGGAGEALQFLNVELEVYEVARLD